MLIHCKLIFCNLVVIRMFYLHTLGHSVGFSVDNDEMFLTLKGTWCIISNCVLYLLILGFETADASKSWIYF